LVRHFLLCIYVVYHVVECILLLFFFSSRRRHTISKRDWSSDVCSSDLSCDITCKVPERATRAKEGMPATPMAIMAVSVDGPHTRSEERRVGKECRPRLRRDD